MKRNNSFTLEDIKKSKVWELNLHLADRNKVAKGSAKRKVKPRNDCKEVQHLHWMLKYWCIEQGLLLVPEHKFSKERKFRLDFAIFKGVTIDQVNKLEYEKENIIAAIEYQGGIFMVKSGHSSPKGATRDCEKSNLAQSIGWSHYFTYTAINYKNVLQDINKIISICKK